VVKLQQMCLSSSTELLFLLALAPLLFDVRVLEVVVVVVRGAFLFCVVAVVGAFLLFVVVVGVGVEGVGGSSSSGLRLAGGASPKTFWYNLFAFFHSGSSGPPSLKLEKLNFLGDKCRARSKMVHTTTSYGR